MSEQLSMYDVGAVFTSGAMPVVSGSDHSIGFPTVHGIASQTDRANDISHFDRHVDIQKQDLNKRAHTTPWFLATNLANVPASNLLQVG